MKATRIALSRNYTHYLALIDETWWLLNDYLKPMRPATPDQLRELNTPICADLLLNTLNQNLETSTN